MDNRNTFGKLPLLINECIDEIISASDEEINTIFDEQHTPTDLEKIKLSIQSALTKHRKAQFRSAKPMMPEERISSIHEKVFSLTSQHIETLLAGFFSNPSNSNIGIAFRNERTQSPHDRATLLEDLILKGLIKLDS